MYKPKVKLKFAVTANFAKNKTQPAQQESKAGERAVASFG